jgi:alkyl sulfatase BDS1-like metallo-beta-lactamase superfamily hydrolase
MSKWLSQEWLDETREMAKSQPERPGATARMQYIVSGGPDGEVRYYWVLENGKLLDSQLGDIEGADITMTMSYDDAMKIQQGDLDPNAAFMQGRIKIGNNTNMAKLMSLMPLTNAPEYKELQKEIRGITQY